MNEDDYQQDRLTVIKVPVNYDRSARMEEPHAHPSFSIMSSPHAVSFLGQCRTSTIRGHVLRKSQRRMGTSYEWGGTSCESHKDGYLLYRGARSGRYARIEGPFAVHPPFRIGFSFGTVLDSSTMHDEQDAMFHAASFLDNAWRTRSVGTSCGRHDGYPVRMGMIASRICWSSRKSTLRSSHPLLSDDDSGTKKTKIRLSSNYFRSIMNGDDGKHGFTDYEY
ncbi:hypothetical protein BJ508DRAFT_315107 [Ascobolus immersus RN42]|uniref:Uncharacterized protein n=1 Tax=Ascobolus immersus RN42 TaxID=1160509 RepID=A0A3N4HFS7_ASCIM|nr:hypothetical protein BJ508DRAFT_315107 [Ascobolus immersus RN42]